jgi:hypothetical protein
MVCGTLKATAPPALPPNFGWGSTPSVSASAPETASDAVVWAISKPDGSAPEGTTRDVLYAFDAMSMQELYDSGQCPADQIAPATKFSVPTVANSFVYIGAQEIHLDNTQHEVNTGLGTFYIFGPTTRSC